MNCLLRPGHLDICHNGKCSCLDLLWHWDNHMKREGQPGPPPRRPGHSQPPTPWLQPRHCLKQWFSTRALPSGDSGTIRRHFQLSQVGVWGVLLTSSEKRPGKLLNILQCPGEPTKQGILGPQESCAEAEKPWSRGREVPTHPNHTVRQRQSPNARFQGGRKH